jgi:methionyl-tRNA formyltransferase
MRVVFIGAGEIGLPTLRSLLTSTEHQLVGVITQPDKPAGRTLALRPPPIKSALAGGPVPLLQPSRIRDPEAIAQIRGWSPDTIVVMAYGQILPSAVLEIPKVACLNLHASLLPRHRGAAPIQAAIVSGDKETGITVMYMDEGLDTGDILLQRSIPISPDETGASLHDRLAEIAGPALRDALELLARKGAPRNPQDSAAATYAPKLARDDGRIDWTEPAAVIERKVRAYDAWPGAFTMLSVAGRPARKLKIFRATILSGPKTEPGRLTRSETELLVAARDGAISLVEVQLEAKRRLNIAEFLRGLPSNASLALG